MAEDIVKKIKEKLGKKITTSKEPNERRFYLDVNPEDVPQAVKYVFDELQARFIIMTGIDTPGGIEILYHFSFDSLNKVVSVRTLIDKSKCEIESVTPIIKGAAWIEREIHDLLGVTFKNHPNLERLILSEDFPEGKYPLRRDYEP